jgi:soluble lytic murein transglycosylase-like protein
MEIDSSQYLEKTLKNQMMTEIFKEMAGDSDSFDIEQNVDGGTKYLKGLLQMYGNSKEMALAAYNAGSGTLRKR